MKHGTMTLEEAYDRAKAAKEGSKEQAKRGMWGAMMISIRRLDLMLDQTLAPDVLKYPPKRGHLDDV